MLPVSVVAPMTTASLVPVIVIVTSWKPVAVPVAESSVSVTR